MNDQSASPGRGGVSSEVYALLAQANLLRMRGCWGEAIENCMAALRLTPDSHSAQSLLGDIYENQERYDDAIQWYRMALDLNPQSPADRSKLERLLDRQRDGLKAPRAPFWDKEAGETEEPGKSLIPAAHLRSEKALRVAALTAALLVLVVLASAYVSIHRRAALSALGLSSGRDVKTPLVVLPSSEAPTPASIPDAAQRDGSEQAVLDSLRASPDLASSGIVVSDAQSDPRTARLILTFAVTPAPSGGLTHETVLRAALHLVQTASALPGTESTNSFTVRCLMMTPTGGGAPSASLVFAGDVPREALPPADPALPAPQVQALFAGPWWSPQLPS